MATAGGSLLDHLPKAATQARFQVAGEKELTRGKFASPESSAALVVKVFGLFADYSEWLSFPDGFVTLGAAQRVDLEVQMRFPWRGGCHPWLDVAIGDRETLIGIESKRYGPFRDRKTATLLSVYFRPVWDKAMAPFEAIRGALGARRSFKCFDAVLLVKHAFGLRTQAQQQWHVAILCYFYAELQIYPDGRAILVTETQTHRDELAMFTAEVTVALAEVTFCSLACADLFAHWSTVLGLADHATAVSARFDMGAR